MQAGVTLNNLMQSEMQVAVFGSPDDGGYVGFENDPSIDGPLMIDMFPRLVIVGGVHSTLLVIDGRSLFGGRGHAGTLVYIHTYLGRY